MVVANPYSQQTLQNRMQPPQFSPIGGQQQGGTNQFSPPPATNNIQPPNFYPIPAGQPNRDPRYSDQFNPNYSGPIYNPYQPPTPYGMNKVSPTGQVQGVAPMGAVAARTAAPGDNGSGSNGGQNTGGNRNGGGSRGNGGNNNGGGGNGGGGNNGGDNKKSGGGGFFKGFYDISPGKKESPADKRAEAFLRSDPALQDTLRQLLGSRGDYRDQFENNMANIENAWHNARNYLSRERGDALNEFDAGLASSGLMRSSDSAGQYEGIKRDFNRQIEEALQAKTEGKTEAFTEKQNFMRQLELAKLQARSDALRRFAAEQMDVGGLLG